MSTAKPSTKKQTVDFAGFVPQLISRLEQVTDEFGLGDFDEHVAFDYWPASCSRCRPKKGAFPITRAPIISTRPTQMTPTSDQS